MGRRFDLAIVDAPATGHGLAMLRAPRTYASIARVGPVGRHAERIDLFSATGRRPAVVSVALPEEMPVNETVEFERALDRELDMAIDAILVNAVHPIRFRPARHRTHPASHRRHGPSRALLARLCRNTPGLAGSTGRCEGCGARPPPP